MRWAAAATAATAVAPLSHGRLPASLTLTLIELRLPCCDSSAMESIEQLLDALPRHFSGVAPTLAALQDADRLTARLRSLAVGGSIGGTDLAGLDR